MILLLDNYDSFVFNLARYLRELGQETEVIRNDRISVEGVKALRPEAIVLSPGPCRPEEAGISCDLVRTLGRRVPLLGVCLGHQAIALAEGAAVVRGEAVHGRSSLVEHDGLGIFDEMPETFRAGRYHSLVVVEESLPEGLEVSARAEDGSIQAIRGLLAPGEAALVGLQFHPESILTEYGHRLLAGFLRLAGVEPRGGPRGGPHLGPQSKQPELPATSTPGTRW